MQTILKHKGYVVGVFFPFIILFVIVLLLLLIQSTSTEISLGTNTIAFTGLAVIALGLIVGIISLIKSSQIKFWWKVFIFVLYMPAVLFSLLLVGL